MQLLKFKTTAYRPDYRAVVYHTLIWGHARNRWLVGLGGAAGAALFALHTIGIIRLPGALYLLALLFSINFIVMVAITEIRIFELFRSGAMPIASERTITVEDRRLVSSAGHGLPDDSYLWDSFAFAKEISRYFLLYLNNQQVIIVSKRDLTDDQNAKFRRILSEKLKGRCQTQ